MGKAGVRNTSIIGKPPRQAAEASESRQTQESVFRIAEISMIELRLAGTEDRRREDLD